MTETTATTTTQAVDADGTQAKPPTTSVPTEPAGPPEPARPIPTDPIDIPDGDPAAGALALRPAVRPDAPGRLDVRFDRMARKISEQVEGSRLDPELSGP